MWYFSSDWHLGHENVIRFSKRPFSSVEQMDSAIIKNMTSPLKRGDEFFFLGDLKLEYSSGRTVLLQLA
jgi:calcineurin-like phosphoesterase family protein